MTFSSQPALYILVKTLWAPAFCSSVLCTSSPLTKQPAAVLQFSSFSAPHLCSRNMFFHIGKWYGMRQFQISKRTIKTTPLLKTSKHGRKNLMFLSKCQIRVRFDRNLLTLLSFSISSFYIHENLISSYLCCGSQSPCHILRKSIYITWNFMSTCNNNYKFSKTLASIQLNVVCEVKNWAHGFNSIKSKSISLFNINYN